MSKKEDKPNPNGLKTDRDSKGKFVQGNPGGPGRPAGSVSLLTAMKQKVDDGENAKVLVDNAFEQAKTNPAYFKMFLDRIDGPVTEESKATVDVRVVFEDA